MFVGYSRSLVANRKSFIALIMDGHRGKLPEQYFRVTGKGRTFIIEGDEYDTAFWDKGPKFLHYFPDSVILTSVEFDHADIYRDLEAVKIAFKRLSKPGAEARENSRLGRQSQCGRVSGEGILSGRALRFRREVAVASCGCEIRNFSNYVARVARWAGVGRVRVPAGRGI